MLPDAQRQVARDAHIKKCAVSPVRHKLIRLGPCLDGIKFHIPRKWDGSSRAEPGRRRRGASCDPFAVMAGLEPAIHVFAAQRRRRGSPAEPGMTVARCVSRPFRRHGRPRAGQSTSCTAVPEGVDPRAEPGDDGREGNTPHVMAGLEPAIHVFAAQSRKAWIPGPSPGMTGAKGNTGDDGACG